MFNRYSKQIRIIKEQYKNLEKNKSGGTDEGKRIEEMKTIIDLLSAYGNQGVSAILGLFTDSTPSEVRTYGYRKIEQIKKPRQ